jgi:tRNA modification GTPase
MDLAQVEGLGDLLSRKPRRSGVQAMRLLQGRWGTWRRMASSLLTALALVEVTIDFADEEVPTDTSGTSH